MKPDFEKTPPLSSATLHILLALAAEDLHGYGIIQKIFRQSDGHYKLGPGTLYDNLKKLIDREFVADAPESTQADEEHRRFYRLTSEGRSVLSVEVNRLRNVVREAELLLRETRPRRV